MNGRGSDQVPRPLKDISDRCASATPFKAFQSGVGGVQRIQLIARVGDLVRGPDLLASLSDAEVASIVAADDEDAGCRAARSLAARRVAEILLSRRRQLQRVATAAGNANVVIDIVLTVPNDASTTDQLRDVCALALHADMRNGSANTVFDESQAWQAQRFASIVVYNRTQTRAERASLLKATMSLISRDMLGAIALDAVQALSAHCTAEACVLPAGPSRDAQLARLLRRERAAARAAVVVLGKSAFAAAVVARSHMLIGLRHGRSGTTDTYVPSRAAADDVLAAFAVARGDLRQSDRSSTRKDALRFVASLSAAVRQRLELAAQQFAEAAGTPVAAAAAVVPTALAIVRASTRAHFVAAAQRFRRPPGVGSLRRRVAAAAAAGAAAAAQPPPSRRQSARIQQQSAVALVAAAAPPPPAPSPPRRLNHTHLHQSRARRVHLFGVDSLVESLHDVDAAPVAALCAQTRRSPLVALFDQWLPAFDEFFERRVAVQRQRLPWCLSLGGDSVQQQLVLIRRGLENIALVVTHSGVVALVDGQPQHAPVASAAAVSAVQQLVLTLLSSLPQVLQRLVHVHDTVALIARSCIPSVTARFVALERKLADARARLGRFVSLNDDGRLVFGVVNLIVANGTGRVGNDMLALSNGVFGGADGVLETFARCVVHKTSARAWDAGSMPSMSVLAQRHAYEAAGFGGTQRPNRVLYVNSALDERLRRAVRSLLVGDVMGGSVLPRPNSVALPPLPAFDTGALVGALGVDSVRRPPPSAIPAQPPLVVGGAVAVGNRWHGN